MVNNNFFTSTAAAALLLFTSVQGHMVMNTPYGYSLYKGSGPELVQVNPLDGGLYKYPCQNHHRVEQRSTVKAGDLQLVNFTGGAQHGGGSCQFSISYDDPEQTNGWNTSATFKTIYTIIGGCPAKFSEAQEKLGSNLPLVAGKDPSQRDETLHCNDDAKEDCTRSFLVPIPDFLPPGKATFAWTWFNKIGNREMYMNCAPIDITGGTPSKENFNKLPNIFIANIPGQKDIPGYDGCVTSEGVNVVNIPYPGEFGRVLDKLDVADPPLAPNKLCDMPPPNHTPSFKPPAVPTTSAPAAGATATKTSQSSISIVDISSASVSGGAKVEGNTGLTFVTAPSDGPPPAATASATGGAGSGDGKESEGGECHDSNATETGAGAGDADIASTVTAAVTLQLTVTTNGPPPASAPPAAATSQAAGAGAGVDTGGGASASAPAPPAATSGLGDSANNAAGDSGSDSDSGGDTGGSGKPQKKQCEKDQVAVCFGDEWFGICDNGWAVPQQVSKGTRCENGSLVHSAVKKEDVKREAREGYGAGERHAHARRHLKRRAGRRGSEDGMEHRVERAREW
ncbi:hypothetical protein B0T09DRAFT_296407 [Sordaria sp. MPI-SDFR-AT-0083]|nr:hypothetical protein B0T09DRAFT_296407 [Sordaria sp. MPI-SDFR-AT-0083]